MFVYPSLKRSGKQSRSSRCLQSKTLSSIGLAEAYIELVLELVLKMHESTSPHITFTSGMNHLKLFTFLRKFTLLFPVEILS